MASLLQRLNTTVISFGLSIVLVSCAQPTPPPVEEPVRPIDEGETPEALPEDQTNIIPEKIDGVRHLFVVEAGTATNEQGSEVPFLAGLKILSQPSDGPYALLDVKGYIGLASIVSSRPIPQRDVGPPFDAMMKLEGTPVRALPQVGHSTKTAHVVAIGPVGEAPTKARLLLFSNATGGLPVDIVHDELGRDPPDGREDMLGWAVDLDGDGRADLLSSWQREIHRSWSKRRVVFTPNWAETWRQQGGRWKLTERCEWTSKSVINRY